MKIEDYLHLYLGCEVQTKNGIDVLVMTGLLGSKEQRAGTLRPFMSNMEPWMDDNKLILRPLSDMTEEEQAEMIKLHREADYKLLPWFYDTYFECVRYLLSRGFDLFGLIESGLAIENEEKRKIQV